MKPIFINTDQGSKQWLDIKLAVISASNAHCVLAGKETEKRKSYMLDLVGQVLTGEQEEINGKALEWGRVNEDNARMAYEFTSGNSVEKVGFCYKDESRRLGCSPDFKVIGKEIGGEIKVPYTNRVYLDFLLNGEIKREYLIQCMWSMYVTGWHEWHFVNFNPRMKSHQIHIQVIERDPKMMARFDEAVPEFLEEMDTLLSRLDARFGDQWK